MYVNPILVGIIGTLMVETAIVAVIVWLEARK